MIVFQLLVTALLLCIFYQDYKTQFVSVLLYVLAGLALSGLHVYASDSISTALYEVLLNLLLLGVLLLILNLYARLVLKQKFLDHVFGSGDAVFLFILALGFSPAVFLFIVGVGSLVALGCHGVLMRFYAFQTVPLAGYLALFTIPYIFIRNFNPALYLW